MDKDATSLRMDFTTYKLGDLDYRLDLAKEISLVTGGGDISKLNSGKLVVGDKFGSKSIRSTSYNMCYYYDCSVKGCPCVPLALKLTPLEPLEAHEVNTHGIEATSDSPFAREVSVLRACRIMVESGVCPNLPLVYGIGISPDCTSITPHEMPGPCGMILNEYANLGDIESWLRSGIVPDLTMWMSLFFQVFAGIYSLHKAHSVSHHDLHWNNVLVHQLPVGTKDFVYIIDGEIYTVPHGGVLFTLWDFETSRQKQIDEDYNEQSRFIEDYARFADVIVWAKAITLTPTTGEIDSLYIQLKDFAEKKTLLRDVFPLVFSIFKSRSLPLGSVWNLDKHPKDYM